MDTFDRKIIHALSADSKLSYNQLSDIVDLSPSACFRRVQALQDSGVIKRFTIQLNSGAIGNNVNVFTEVKVNRQNVKEVERFKKVIRDRPEIISCHQLSGHTDFMLQISTRSIDQYVNFIERELLTLPAVNDASSSIVLKEIKPYSVTL